MRTTVKSKKTISPVEKESDAVPGGDNRHSKIHGFQKIKDMKTEVQEV